MNLTKCGLHQMTLSPNLAPGVMPGLHLVSTVFTTFWETIYHRNSSISWCQVAQ